MAERWHVNDKGQVERCRAKFRKCPYRDFGTKHQAEYHAEWMDIQRRADRLQEQIGNPNNLIPVNFGTSVSPSETVDTQRLIDAIDGNDERFLLYRENIGDGGWLSKEITIELSRRPVLNREAGIIRSEWCATVEGGSRAYPKKSERIVFDGDFNYDYASNEGGNYAAAIEQIRGEVRQRIIPKVTNPLDVTPDSITSDMIRRVEERIATIEPELSNDSARAYLILGVQGNDYGTFSKSDIFSRGISVSEPIQTTLFRGSSVDGFVKSSAHFGKVEQEFPSNVWLYDSPQGTEGAWWGVSCQGVGRETQWGFQSHTAGSEADDVQTEFGLTPDELKERVESFIGTSNLHRNREEAAILPERVRSIASQYNDLLQGYGREADEHQASKRNGTKEVLEEQGGGGRKRNALDAMTDIFS